MLRGKSIVLNVFIKKLGKPCPSNLVAHLNALKQKEENAQKMNRRQEIHKMRAGINQLETKKAIKRINKTKSWLFEKINNIDTPLAKLNKGCSNSIQVNKMKREI